MKCKKCHKKIEKYIVRKSYLPTKKTILNHVHTGTSYYKYGLCKKSHYTKISLDKTIWDKCITCQNIEYNILNDSSDSINSLLSFNSNENNNNSDNSDLESEYDMQNFNYLLNRKRKSSIILECKKEDVDKKKSTRDDLKNELRNEIRDELRNEIRDEIYKEIDDKLSKEASNNIMNKIADEMTEGVRNNLEKQIRDELKKEKQNISEKKIIQNIHKKLNIKIHNNMKWIMKDHICKGIKDIKEIISPRNNKKYDKIFNPSKSLPTSPRYFTVNYDADDLTPPSPPSRSMSSQYEFSISSIPPSPPSPLSL